ncbi:MAG TPA: EAL domain-containing protein [Acidimicrobiia bacterium]|nr:EAL domain-containing protein [Acidimicrobiia bacterium]
MNWALLLATALLTAAVVSVPPVREVVKRTSLRVWSARPRGGLLPDDVWARRHARIVAVLWAHVPAIVLFAAVTGRGWLHGAIESTPVVLTALLARSPSACRAARAAMATLGLVTTSAILVHLSGGLTEMHFHFFVVIGIITLYQDWLPFLLALGFVILHHGVMGAIDPRSVYDHADAYAHPWKWAMIHGGFVLAASMVYLSAWRLNEEVFLHDPLTNLANRRLFEERLSHAVLRGARDTRPIMVLFLDVDDFKTVNDSLGHAAGDQLLITVAERLTQCVRAADTVCRLGGDEFAVLLEGADPEYANALAERLLGVLHAPMILHGKEVSVTASIGIAGNFADQDADGMLRDADAAMYAAKRNGKAHYSFFEPTMHESLSQRVEMHAELQRAVKEGEFLVYYQPTLELATSKLTGVEALVRWDHPTRGVVPPGEFIPLAEETGLIVPIGRWVLAESCRQVHVWNQLVPAAEALTLHVNMSARQLQAATLTEDVAAILGESGFEPRNLVLEITEGVLVHDPEAAIAKLNEIKRLGVRLAIDDFGTGYSSLSYLQRFPIDILKIDKSFVDHVTDGGTASALARAIVKLGPTLGLEVVAEGIETAEQAEELRALQCDQGQGYYFSHPLPAEDLGSVLAAWTASMEADRLAISAGPLVGEYAETP